jgi:hypothetical protein
MNGEICTFCGEPAKRSDVLPSTQMPINSCKSADCLNKFRALIEGKPSDTRAYQLERETRHKRERAKRHKGRR